MRNKNGKFLKNENGGIIIDFIFIIFGRKIKCSKFFMFCSLLITIISIFNPIDKIFNFVQYLLEGSKKEDSNQGKKNGIFY